eukprot:10264655-Karenia_brevis.AAC.1
MKEKFSEWEQYLQTMILTRPGGGFMEEKLKSLNELAACYQAYWPRVKTFKALKLAPAAASSSARSSSS